MPNYVVTCCDQLIALLVDDRPNGALTVVSDPKSTALVIGYVGQVELEGVGPTK